MLKERWVKNTQQLKKQQQKTMEKSKGLGDTVAKITRFTGIKMIVDAVVEDCKCEQRQNWLNGKVPYDGKNVQRVLKLFKK